MRLGVTPVPIPNTTVKPQAAESTTLETTWEARWLPDSHEATSHAYAQVLCRGCLHPKAQADARTYGDSRGVRLRSNLTLASSSVEHKRKHLDTKLVRNLVKCSQLLEN